MAGRLSLSTRNAILGSARVLAWFRHRVISVRASSQRRNARSVMKGQSGVSRGAYDRAGRAELLERGSRGEGNRLAVAAMFPVHAHRLEQAGLAPAGRPHRHRRHRVALVVIGDQARAAAYGNPAAIACQRSPAGTGIPGLKATGDPNPAGSAGAAARPPEVVYFPVSRGALIATAGAGPPMPGWPVHGRAA